MDKDDAPAIWKLGSLGQVDITHGRVYPTLPQKSPKPSSEENKGHGEQNYLEPSTYRGWLIHWPWLPWAMITHWARLFWEALPGNWMHFPSTKATIKSQVKLLKHNKTSEMWWWDVLTGTGGHHSKVIWGWAVYWQVWITWVQNLSIEVRIWILILNAQPRLSLVFVISGFPGGLGSIVS